MGFYDEMQDVASEVLAEFAQGTVLLIRTTTTVPDPDEPWNTVTTEVEYPLDAAVRRVEQKYVDGTTIVGTEDQITFAVPEIVPTMGDTIKIDGVSRTLKDLRPMPAAGTPVAYIAFVAS